MFKESLKPIPQYSKLSAKRQQQGLLKQLVSNLHFSQKPTQLVAVGLVLVKIRRNIILIEASKALGEVLIVVEAMVTLRITLAIIILAP